MLLIKRLHVPTLVRLETSARGLSDFRKARNTRGLDLFKEPPRYEDVEIPEGERRLVIMDKVPQYPHGVRPPKMMKDLSKIRGPETVHNRLVYNQYGVMALCGGWISTGHFDMMRNAINKKIDLSRTFAAWRIDPPWKAITKKGQGKRMGKGKGSIDHYVTPVKAGRMLFEVGGAVDFEAVEPFLQEVCYKLPIDAIPVSKEILDKIEAKLAADAARNINPFSMRRVIDYEMHGSWDWLSKYDKFHHGDYL